MARIAVGDGRQFWATALDPADVAARGLHPTLSAFARDLRTLAVATARACVEKQKAAS
jgi:hypothetical protein